MCHKQNNPLDSLYDDADQGICSNDIQNNVDIGLTNLSEGLTSLTHGLARSSFTYETSEKHKNED